MIKYKILEMVMDNVDFNNIDNYVHVSYEKTTTNGFMWWKKENVEVINRKIHWEDLGTKGIVFLDDKKSVKKQTNQQFHDIVCDFIDKRMDDMDKEREERRKKRDVEIMELLDNTW